MDARAVTPPTRQFMVNGQFMVNEPEVEAMTTTNNMPSPIEIENSITQKSHFNAINDSNLEAQAYDQTTITNLTNVDEPFMGGLSQQGATG